MKFNHSPDLLPQYRGGGQGRQFPLPSSWTLVPVSLSSYCLPTSLTYILFFYFRFPLPILSFYYHVPPKKLPGPRPLHTRVIETLPCPHRHLSFKKCSRPLVLFTYQFTPLSSPLTPDSLSLHYHIPLKTPGFPSPLNSGYRVPPSVIHL